MRHKSETGYLDMRVEHYKKGINTACAFGHRTAGYLCKERPFSKGFTIIEIIIVVVILAIAAVMAVPLLSSADSVQLKAAANIVASDLEYAKSISITRGQNFTVVFDENSESYEIKDQAGDVISHPVKTGFNYVVSFAAESRLSRVDIVDVSFGSNSEVTFNYLGSPDNGGFVQLGVDGAGVVINVEPVTGFISIEEI